MNAAATASAPSPSTPSDTADRPNFLTAGHGLKSWLLTLDHKRVAMLYLIAVSGYFLLGGIFGVLLAILFVAVRPLEQALLPWVIASQTVPIIALVPALISTTELRKSQQAAVSGRVDAALTHAATADSIQSYAACATGFSTFQRANRLSPPRGPK
mgnify:CR=1 FL=1